MLQNEIKFICNREIPVPFYSLVIKVESINRLYQGGFESFFLNGHSGITNGSIVVISEMFSCPDDLYFLIEELEQMGFKLNEHYVAGLEEHPLDVLKLPNQSKPIDWCTKVDWLQSIVLADKGNLVWPSSFIREFDIFAKTLYTTKNIFILELIPKVDDFW